LGVARADDLFLDLPQHALVSVCVVVVSEPRAVATGS
jgi:hypothetical protein